MPILHVVDEATRFQAAVWLNEVSAVSLWCALRCRWIDVYLRPPDVIAHDAGMNFTSRPFAANADMLHISTKSIPVESANLMLIVERYHVSLHRAFNNLKKEVPDLNNNNALQMAIKSVNDFVRPDGLDPRLLIFSTIPRLGLPTDSPTPSPLQRTIALRQATVLMSRHFAKRKSATRCARKTDLTSRIFTRHRLARRFSSIVRRRTRKKDLLTPRGERRRLYRSPLAVVRPDQGPFDSCHTLR